MTDLILTIAHHLAVFALAGILAVEAVLVRPGLAGANLRLVGAADRAYGGLAGAVIVIGVLRVMFGLKGWEFYVWNPMFWAKMVAFGAVGLLSVPPTIAILRWVRAARGEQGYTPPDSEIAAARRWIVLEVLIFASIPALAAALARGYGV